jgi:hypothetical protein
MKESYTYTWVITMDIVPLDVTNPSVKVGPSGSKNRAPLGDVIKRGEHFRLLNSSGEARISGYILGEYQGREPLDDYGRELGCTDIQYKRGGEWVSA